MREKVISKVLSVLIAIAMVATMIQMSGYSDKVKASDDTTTFENLNQSEIVTAMGAGWNLGNQLEASSNGTPSETAYGNPTIKEGLIKAVKAAGFTTVRIPVSYLSKIGDSSSGYKINETWLERVKTVVDMCIDNGLYVIINIHGDGYNSVSGGWLLCNGSDQTTIKAKYAAVWSQIATKFADYDEHLVFESLNEEFDGTYNTPNKTYYSNINAYNQLFVDTVRQSGGNNDKRWLLIPGWNTNIDYTAGNYGFSLPTDSYLSSDIPSSEKRIMISVHYYSPWSFCGDESSTVTEWGANATKNTDTWGGESYLISQLALMKTNFVNKGYPVVIGEYGSIDKSSVDSTNPTYRAYFAKKVCEVAKEDGCVPVIWDNGYNGKNGFGLFNRTNFSVKQQGIIDAIMSIYPSGVAPSTTSAAPATTSAAPVTTSAAPSTTSAAPSTTSAAPSTTSAAPSTTSAAPSTTSAAPATTSAAPSTTDDTTLDNDILVEGKTYDVNGIKYVALSNAEYDENGNCTKPAKVSYAGKAGTSSAAYVKVPNVVTVDGEECYVTEISTNAFTNTPKVKSIVIGSKVTKISQNAFSGLDNLKSIVIKSKVLKKINGTATFDLNKKTKVTVYKKNYVKYKKLIKKAGGKKLKIVKA